MTLESPASTANLTVGPDPDRDPPITTEDLADIANATEAEQMQPYVDAAIGYVEDRCGPIEPCQWVFQVPQKRDGRLLLTSGPLASLDLLLDPDGNDLTGSVSVGDVDWQHGTVLAPVHAGGVWLVQVTTSREANAVSSLKEAAKIIARHLWSVRKGPLQRTSNPFGDQGAPTAVAALGVGYAIPSRAQEIVAAYAVNGA